MSATRSLAAALCLSLVACGGHQGGDSPTTPPPGRTSPYGLTLVGNANFTLHPSEKRTLQVVLAQDKVGPVTNAKVHFEFQDGDPAGASVEAQDVTTDSSGIATVHFTAGTTAASRPTYKLVASAPSYSASPVAFSFNIIPVRRLLEIVGTPATHVGSDGQTAEVLAGISTSDGLKVRELDQDTGNPIAGDTILFTLPAAAHMSWSGVSGKTATAQTGSGGEAQVFLVTTQVAEGPVLVQALSQAGGAAVSFSVTVQAVGTGAGCTSSQGCAPGQICVGGKCEDGNGGGGGCNNGSDNPCPFGYVCDTTQNPPVCVPPGGGACDPKLNNCASGQCCNSASQCVDSCPACGPGTHCDTTAACGQAQCVPDAVPTPDVSGVWLTKHTYSIAEALPTTVRDIFYGLRLLDQALLGKLGSPPLPSWIPGWALALINKVVSNVLVQYLPPWLQTVIHLSDDLAVILSNLRSEGSMRLSNGIDAQHVKGTEVWTSLVFYYLPLCGDNIGGDPGAPPDCARIDLATTDSDNPGEVGQCKGQSLPSITVQVAPFTGSVANLGTGAQGPFQLNVDQRQVRLKMGKVVLVLVDTILSYLTPYHCIEEATDCANGNPCMVDCAGLGRDVENLTQGLVPANLIEQACDEAVTAAGQLVTNALANAWPVSAEVLDFSGHASITPGADSSLCDPGANGPCASQLGNDSYDKDLQSSDSTRRDARDGNWTGDFFFHLIHKLPGAWEGKRAQ